MSALVEADGVGVQFLFDRQQRTVSPTTRRLRRYAGEHWALRDITFQAGSGEAIALLGSSGSGKSTLLRVLSDVLRPDVGSIRVTGPVGSLLSVHAGVMALLTGRENTVMLGVLAGLTNEQARASVPAVQEASGLGEHFERLVASYSQGMRARLGLSIIEQTNPRVLLLDEIHEALDHEFRDHMADYCHRLVESGGAVFAAGHDHPMLERLGTRALLLEGGRIVDDGPFDTVRRHYLAV